MRIKEKYLDKLKNYGFEEITDEQSSEFDLFDVRLYCSHIQSIDLNNAIIIDVYRDVKILTKGDNASDKIGKLICAMVNDNIIEEI